MFPSISKLTKAGSRFQVISAIANQFTRSPPRLKDHRPARLMLGTTHCGWRLPHAACREEPMPGLTNRALFRALAAIVIYTTTSGIVFAQDRTDPSSPTPVIPPAAPASQPPQANAQPTPAQPAP